MLRILQFAILLAIGQPLLAASPGQLTSAPAAVASYKPPYKSQMLSLPGGARAYLPPGAGNTGPAPLLVIFHGTGGSGAQMINFFREYADREGIVLLAPLAAGSNWDSVDTFFDKYEVGRIKDQWPAPEFGRDLGRVDAAMAALFARVPIDPRRIGALGYSHGASYALMLGTANPKIFSSIIALSPGILILNKDVAGGQRIYVAHGTEDQQLPFWRTEKNFVPRLGKLGYSVKFRPFTGGHALHPDAIQEAIDLFLKP